MKTVTMTELLTTIAKAICDKPEDVSVKEIPASLTSVLEIKVHPSDLGKMIGKNGKTANAIRSLIYAASFKYKKRYVLEIDKHQ